MKTVRPSSITLLILLILAAYFALPYAFRYAICSYLDAMHIHHAQKSNIPIEIVLVTAEKDFEILPHTITSIKKYIQHPISKITLVAKGSDKAKILAKSLDVEFVNEDDLLSLTEFKAYIKTNNLQLKHRPEWYYQQFLKLYFYKKAQARYYFVIDADIILTQPMTLVNNEGVHSFYIGDYHGHHISQLSVAKILGQQQFMPSFSFIADLMCFNKNTVKDLIQFVENRENKSFHHFAIEVEQGSSARFSEYELYGIYANFHGANKIIPTYMPLSQIRRERSSLDDDMMNPNFRFAPYIAYHRHYIPNTNKAAASTK